MNGMLILRALREQVSYSVVGSADMADEDDGRYMMFTAASKIGMNS